MYYSPRKLKPELLSDALFLFDLYAVGFPHFMR
jgi:hypothetical protein